MYRHSETHILNYLDTLKKSTVNLYECKPTLVEKFGLTEAEATSLINLWFRTFSERFLVRQEKTSGQPLANLAKMPSSSSKPEDKQQVAA